MALLELKNVRRIYKTKNVTTTALKEINFTAEAGEFISIMGESGAGKTTLLNIIATLDKPTAGSVILNGKDISNLKDNEISQFRRNELGFVFQDFNLLDQFSNRDNIYLPLVLSNEDESVMKTRLDQLKDRLGIAELLDKYPYEISGGQKQRIAIARAVITKPSLLLADEPTGSLDSKTSTKILKQLIDLHRSNNVTLIIVTHDMDVANLADRVIEVLDGKLVNAGDNSLLENKINVD